MWQTTFVEVRCGGRGLCERILEETIEAYQLLEVVKDYGTEPKPLQALMAVLAGSDCPLVAKWREAMAQAFADANADEVDEVINGL